MIQFPLGNDRTFFISKEFVGYTKFNREIHHNDEAGDWFVDHKEEHGKDPSKMWENTPQAVKIGVPVALALAAIVALGILASYGYLGVGAQTFMTHAGQAISGIAAKSWIWISTIAAPKVWAVMHAVAAKVQAVVAKVGAFIKANTNLCIGVGAGIVGGALTLAVAAFGIKKIRENRKEDVEKKAKKGPGLFQRLQARMPSLPSIPNPFKKENNYFPDPDLPEPDTTETTPKSAAVVPSSLEIVTTQEYDEEEGEVRSTSESEATQESADEQPDPVLKSLDAFLRTSPPAPGVDATEAKRGEDTFNGLFGKSF